MTEEEWYEALANSSDQTVAGFAAAGDEVARELIAEGWPVEAIEEFGLEDHFEIVDEEAEAEAEAAEALDQRADAFEQGVRDLEAREGRTFSDGEVEAMAGVLDSTGLPADMGFSVHTAYEAVHKPHGGPPDLNDQDTRRMELAQAIADDTVDSHLADGDIDGAGEFLDRHENALSVYHEGNG